jgi:hypothetical protein
MSLGHWWNDNWQRKTKVLGKKSALSTTNPAWITLLLNSGLHSKKPASKCLSCDTAMFPKEN